MVLSASSVVDAQLIARIDRVRSEPRDGFKKLTTVKAAALATS
jgi:hypothetical protein